VLINASRKRDFHELFVPCARQVLYSSFGMLCALYSSNALTVNTVSEHNAQTEESNAQKKANDKEKGKSMIT